TGSLVPRQPKLHLHSKPGRFSQQGPGPEMARATWLQAAGFDQPLMIVLASSRILELGARSRKASDHPGLISCRPQRQRRKTHPIYRRTKRESATLLRSARFVWGCFSDPNSHSIKGASNE